MAIFNLEYYKGTDIYSDGDVEDTILEIVKSGRTIDDLSAEEISFPILYHLSRERENVLNWYCFRDEASVLEIGAGCGAITGMLCQKNKKVVSVDLSKRRASINYERNKDKDNLEIWVGNLNDMEFGELFDYVVLNGVFEYAISFTEGDKPYQTFLNNITKYLKPDGIVLIAIENRLGLKYFAGAPEDHTDSFLLGINEYIGNNNVRTFSKAELTEILDDCGFENKRFYYPYPDYKFPNVIYTDETINEFGYGNDYFDFQGKRMLLFNEKMVADSIAREGGLGIFSNSFLVEACREKIVDDEKVIFAKLNSDRKENYRIKTVIRKKSQKCEVIKEALSEKAKKHIDRLEKNSKIVINDNIRYLSAEKGGDLVKYKYIYGETLSQKLLKLIDAQDKEAFEKIFDKFICDTLYNQGFESRYGGEQFKAVFGTDENGSELCLNPANIDLILDNVFCENEKCYIIDAEWIFDFPIPVKFVVWRIVNELYSKNPQIDAVVSREEICKKYLISVDDEKKYVEWNRFFTQEYVGANGLRFMAKEKLQVSLDDVYKERRFDRKIFSSLYLDYGEGYKEENKIYLESDLESGKFSISYTLKNDNEIQTLRWDPVENRLCVCKLEAYKSGEWVRITKSNAEDTTEEGEVFYSPDPYYEIGKEYIQEGQLLLRGSIKCFDVEEMVNVTENLQSQKNDIRVELERRTESLQGTQKYVEKLENDYRRLDAEHEGVKAEFERNSEILQGTQKYVEKLENDYRRLDAMHEELKEQKEELDRRYELLNDSYIDLERRNDDLETANSYLNQTLETIYNSKSWKVLSKFREAKSSVKSIIKKKGD